MMVSMRAAFKPGVPVPTYHEGCRCPGCGRNHWHIGRVTAECAFCSFPMQLPEVSRG